jgi:hypothetical protein
MSDQPPEPDDMAGVVQASAVDPPPARPAASPKRAARLPASSQSPEERERGRANQEAIEVLMKQKRQGRRR